MGLTLQWTSITFWWKQKYLESLNATDQDKLWLYTIGHLTWLNANATFFKTSTLEKFHSSQAYILTSDRH